MIDFAHKDSYSLDDLIGIIRMLRSENGCPWDREQNHKSIRRNLLEEAYEVAEAIDEEDSEHLREELGDLLLQVIFHAVMEEEAGRFDLDGVADLICKKLIRRHPHIFGDDEADTADEVLDRWDEIKRRERGQTTQSESMTTVARSLPALWRAEKVQSKARKAGFDWPDVSGALDKLSEEVEECRQAAAGKGDPEEELGDLLFSAVNVSRFFKVDPETALSKACDKFIARFRGVERLAAEQGKELSDMSLEEMDGLWDEVKRA
jgi:tetrapyrrole methylase family protein/MazG family protein